VIVWSREEDKVKHEAPFRSTGQKQGANKDKARLGTIHSSLVCG
jgi:hypothetical protein